MDFVGEFPYVAGMRLGMLGAVGLAAALVVGDANAVWAKELPFDLELRTSGEGHRAQVALEVEFSATGEALDTPQAVASWLSDLFSLHDAAAVERQDSSSSAPVNFRPLGGARYEAVVWVAPGVEYAVVQSLDSKALEPAAYFRVTSAGLDVRRENDADASRSWILGTLLLVAVAGLAAKSRRGTQRPRPMPEQVA